jgi:hypothetical protein
LLTPESGSNVDASTIITWKLSWGLAAGERITKFDGCSLQSTLTIGDKSDWLLLPV